MKILKILDSHDTGGIYTCECQFIEDMVSRGHQVDGVIIGRGKNVEVYKELLSNYIHLEKEFIYREFRDFGSFYKMNQCSKELAKKIDANLYEKYSSIIYRRTAFLFIAGHLSRLWSINTYWFMPKSMQSQIQRYFYLFFLKIFDISPIANSKYTQKTLGKYCRDFVYPGFDESKVIETEDNFRSELKISEEVPVYGIAARLDYEKAHDIVLSAFINSGIPQNGGHLIIAGKPLGGEYFEKLKEISGSFLNNKIHFLGYIENMAKFYASVNIMVNGRRDAEPFGITVAEALAFGKPVIAYDLGGPSEMIEDNKNGWLVKKPTYNSYKEAFKRSIAAKDQWKSFSIYAQENASKYSSKNSVTKILRILAEDE